MQMGQRFSLDLTPEEAILLLTGARLLDKLVAGINIQAKDHDELIRNIIRKLSREISPELVGLSNEIAEVILESLFTAGELEEDDVARVAACCDMDELDAEESPCNYPMYATDETLPKLEHALTHHHTVRVHYYSFARETVDVINLNPFTIFRENDLWKVVAYCHERAENMIFRVDRIKEIVETVREFRVPSNFSPSKQLPFAS